MKINLSLTVEDAQRVLRILHDTRHALTANAASATWGIPGVPDINFDISDVILMEDVMMSLLEAADKASDHVHFAGCCQVF